MDIMAKNPDDLCYHCRHLRKEHEGKICLHGRKRAEIVCGCDGFVEEPAAPKLENLTDYEKLVLAVAVYYQAQPKSVLSVERVPDPEYRDSERIKGLRVTLFLESGFDAESWVSVHLELLRE